MDANHILNLATTAGVLAMIACPVLAIILGGLVGWSRRLADRNAAQAVTIAALERRLADVEAIRSRDTIRSVIGHVMAVDTGPDRFATITASLAPGGLAELERAGLIPSAESLGLRQPAPGVYSEDQGRG
jgi:hypothetical protein